MEYILTEDELKERKEISFRDGFSSACQIHAAISPNGVDVILEKELTQSQRLSQLDK